MLSADEISCEGEHESNCRESPGQSQKNGAIGKFLARKFFPTRTDQAVHEVGVNWRYVQSLFASAGQLPENLLHSAAEIYPQGEHRNCRERWRAVGRWLKQLLEGIRVKVNLF